nr:NADH dehydrogenase subunit 6 [Oribatula sakamorii]
MTALTTITLSKMTKSMNPINLTIALLVISILIALLLFKAILSSWLAFILILTFSSGMLTLFIYAASLTPNEKSKQKGFPIFMIVLILMSIQTPMKPTSMKTSMKSFSSQTFIMIMTSILILTMISISKHSFNPQQSISTSF